MTIWIEMIDIEKYEKVRFLGRGTYGEVYEYKLVPKEDRDVANFPEKIAIKKIVIMEEAALKGYQREMEALSKTKHVNILKFLPFLSTGALKLALEFCNCDLNKLAGHKLWISSLDQVKTIARQVATGIDYLHRFSSEQGSIHGIVHRDIKPANILLQYQGELDAQFPELKNVVVKISDFQLSRVIVEGGSSSLSTVGTERYMSPEMARAQNENASFKSPQPLKTDVFSAGILFFHMRYNKFPFKFIQLAKDEQPEVDFDQKKEQEQDEEDEKRFRDLCGRMLRWDLEERLSMEAVLKHGFFSQ